MLKKLGQEIKKIIVKYRYFICFFIITMAIMSIELPYYIKKTGGIINIAQRIQIENGYETKGTLNMAYVTEIRATIPSFLIAKVNNDWDIVSKKDEIGSTETNREVDFRNKLALDEANNNAIIVAYQKANKDITINSKELFVIYIDEVAKTDLKIGDKIVSINDIEIRDSNDISKIVNESDVNDNLIIKVINNDVEVTRNSKIINYDGEKMIGIILGIKYDMKLNPTIEFSFKNNESGASGGLMMSLAIYNSLVPEDITKGRNIVGTGTINVNGEVGQIDGVIYKLKGAVKNGASIFLVPSGENYEDALVVKEKYNYDIEIVKISTFEEALDYLKK